VPRVWRRAAGLRLRDASESPNPRRMAARIGRQRRGLAINPGQVDALPTPGIRRTTVGRPVERFVVRAAAVIVAGATDRVTRHRCLPPRRFWFGALSARGHCDAFASLLLIRRRRRRSTEPMLGEHAAL
jgi:hypothetical protein